MGDYDLSYIDAIKTQQRFIAFCEENNWYEKKIFTGFNSGVNLTSSIAGYRNTDTKFIKTTDSLTNDVEFCVFTNIEPRTDYDSLLNELNLGHLTSFEENKVWIDVYKLNGFVNDSTPHIAVKKRKLKAL